MAIQAGARAALPRPASLVVSADLFDEILAHLLAAAPLEGVGLIAVPEETEREDGALEVDDPAHAGRDAWVAVRFYPGTNGAASPTRYTMPPEEVLAALQDMAANGWRLGAIAHSHPRGPATPSPTDLREAFYPEALMVIVSLAESRAQARAWWVGEGDGQPREVPIVVTRDPNPRWRRGSDG